MVRLYLKGPFAERLWKRVDRAGGPEACWPWMGACSQGYGITSRVENGTPSKVRAHRAAWELTNGPVAAGLFVLHRCDNPPCCNPAHLFLGTNADNMRDCAVKLRIRPRHRLLTPEMVAQARSYSRSGVLTKAEIAALYGVSPSTVSHACTGRNWKHVGV